MFGFVLLLVTLCLLVWALMMGGLAVVIRQRSMFSVATAFSWGVLLGPVGVLVVAMSGRRQSSEYEDHVPRAWGDR